MKKKEPFQPRRIDEFATEVSPGQVAIEGLPGTFPLEEYLKTKEEEAREAREAREGRTRNLQRKEKDARALLTRSLKAYLAPLQLKYKDLDWLTFLRRLAWTTEIYPDSLKCLNLRIAQPGPEKYQLSDYLRACTLLLDSRPLPDELPTEGYSPCLVSAEVDGELRLQRKEVVWTTILKTLQGQPAPEEKKKKITLEDLDKKLGLVLKALKVKDELS